MCTDACVDIHVLSLMFLIYVYKIVSWSCGVYTVRGAYVDVVVDADTW